MSRCAQQVRLPQLQFGQDGVHVEVEVLLAQDQLAAFDAGLARATGIGIEERAAQAVAAGVGKDQQAAHGAAKKQGCQPSMTSSPIGFGMLRVRCHRR
jgi:hypothetical protein